MPRKKLDLLTPKEKAVLECAACGMEGPETAEYLGIGYETVRTHRKHALEALNTHTITGACFVALVLGEIDLSVVIDHMKTKRRKIVGRSA